MAASLQQAQDELQNNIDQATSDLQQSLETIEKKNIELAEAQKEMRPRWAKDINAVPKKKDEPRQQGNRTKPKYRGRKGFMISNFVCHVNLSRSDGRCRC